MTIEPSSDDLVAAVSHKLAFNERAYGKAWTGEEEDTRFIVQPLLDEVERLREAISEHKLGNSNLSTTNLNLWTALDG